MTKAILAVLLTVGVVAGIIVIVGRSDGGSNKASPPTTTSTTVLTAAQLAERSESEAWNAEATDAFGGQALNKTIQDLLNGVNDWKSGKKSSADFATELDTHLKAFVLARDRMHALRPYPQDPRVNDFYGRSANLYVEAIRVYQDMVALPATPARDQTELMARRIRELADRIFDRGRALVDAHLYVEPAKDVELRLPEEVPNWVAEGLAPGPPLDDPPPPADPLAPIHQDTRPTTSTSGWLSAVAASGAPPAPDLPAAITAGDGARLQAVGRAFVGAAEKLRNQPDPAGPEGREEGARFRLGLLVDGEAARAAQLATVIGDPTLAAHLGVTARRLALVGEGLSAPGVPPRSSGFDPGLLAQNGP
ncbi:MAG: hypothetical protein QOG64_459 [Acidimicrobiaceae bacterium]|nr:hypothetical protein [Acidimicrobiaceae bacterium]